MIEFSDEEAALLTKYVSNLDKDIYVIYNLPPEVAAVLFAYYSRSPLSFRENLLKLIRDKDIDVPSLTLAHQDQGFDFSRAKEKASKFHEKWVVGYGHSSVAEHASASVAIENISMIATKIIEDNRLASYTEKSSRYQIFDKTRYYTPSRIKNSQYADLYKDTMDFLFNEYNRLIKKVSKCIITKYPKLTEESEQHFKSVLKARTCDVCRYLLPAGTLTNLGMTANARTYEHAIKKFLSHELKEVNLIGKQIKAEVQKIIPTLVKYADNNKYMYETNKGMEEYTSKLSLPADTTKSVTLVKYDESAYDKAVTSILYRYSKSSYSEIDKLMKRMSIKEKENVLDKYLGKMGKYDYPMRELEHIYYTFDILVDFGAFRDIQRHRICTQTTQDLTNELGYSVPQEIIESGFAEDFKCCMKRANEAYEKVLKDFPKEAQYLIPLAYRKRVLITWNLRQLFHFIKLRSSREGHISYRRIAWQCFDEIRRVHPLFAKYLRVDKSQGPAR
ncbi:FAD-dependent thymidylate synthase [Candidatus Woesearchaeota archaeon]|nr:FAD-dependent thymidylate synthase [Candidatus Woesearchaeota archaeon]